MMTMDLSRIIPPPAGALTADRTFTLSAGELFERIPIEPGAKADARLSLPESIRRAAPADPEVTQFAEMAVHQAATELGLEGTIGLQWFTAEQSSRPTFMLGEGDRVAAHLRLDGFATAFQTDPPSLWLRLDSRRATAAEFSRLIRHEVAHLYLEIRGLPSGPVHEALADTFADGGMPALAGAFGLGDSPPVLALNPGNASSTVIIDGTSDMFKIAATGTLAPAAPTAGNETTATATLATGLTFSPASQWFVATGIGDQPLPCILWERSDGTLYEQQEGYAVWVAGNQTQVTARHQLSADAGSTYSYTNRYYIFAEAAI